MTGAALFTAWGVAFVLMAPLWFAVAYLQRIAHALERLEYRSRGSE